MHNFESSNQCVRNASPNYAAVIKNRQNLRYVDNMATVGVEVGDV